MLKRQFCRTVAHYCVRAYGSKEYVERGNFWGYFPFNDPCIWRTLEGLAAVSMQEKANGAGPGVLTLLGTVVPLPRLGLSHGRRDHPGCGEAMAWAGSQGICSIPHDGVKLCHLVKESCRAFHAPPGFCGSWEQSSLSDMPTCPLWSRGMCFGIFKPRDCSNCVQ